MKATMGNRKFERRHVVFGCLALASLLLILYKVSPSKKAPDDPFQSVVTSLPKITFNPTAGLPQNSDVIPAYTRYFTQQFVVHGLGHKFSELLMGVRFARLNNLTYILDEKTFLYNYRHTNLTWIGDLLKRRFGTTLNDFSPVFDPKEWVHTDDFMNDAAVLYQEALVKEGRPYKGFFADVKTQCHNPVYRNRGCWNIGVSFLNDTRDLQDLLSHPDKKDVAAPKEQENQDPIDQSAVIVDRVAIHVRLGDITNMLTPETYRDLIRGIEIYHQVTIPPENVHFVYYGASSYNRYMEDYKAIRALQDIMPQARYHNYEDTWDTIRFLAHSKYLVTSGSSLSYMAAYLCAECHVIFTMPKEFIGYLSFDESTYFYNFYYMDEWIPDFRYLRLVKSAAR
ncbi:hypothetical protein BGX34_008188 [Mortierella sp. NVP85]|nr:hypothetical protein BGX34_008188 [Mortierella sp. NVP85]